MYEFNNVEDLSKAVDMYGNYSKTQLIAELCYYKDRFNLELKQSTWLNDLANHLRDTDDKEMREASDESYEEYLLFSIKFNKKWM